MRSATNVLDCGVRYRRREKILRQDQTVYEMAEEVLERQAKALVARTGQPFRDAMETVAGSDAGRRLRELAEGECRDEKAAEWQASLPWKRIEERHYS
jgi:hypothetical protein